MALVISVVAACAFPRMNEDLFMGLCLGREVAGGTFTEPNHWSFVMPPTVYVDRAWLSHVVYYLSYLTLGNVGPLLIRLILLAGCLAVLYGRCRWLSASPTATITALTLSMFALAPFLSIRGENFGVLWFLVLTAILAAPSTWGRWRQIGALVVVVLWSNCHGTWPMGAALVGLRFCLDLAYTMGLLEVPSAGPVSAADEEASARPYRFFRRATPQSAGNIPDAGGWLVVLILMIPALVLGSPYGAGNLSVFANIWRTDEFERVIPWRDNLPLIHPTATLETKYYDTNSVLPFLTLLAALVLMIIIVTASSSRHEWRRVVLQGPGAPDRAMEIALLLVIISLTFRWRRLLVFAAPCVAPVMALLIDSTVETVRERFRRWRESGAGRASGLAAIASALLLVSFAGLFFFKSVIRSYMPNNPAGMLRIPPSLEDRLISYNMVWRGIEEFLGKNKIDGRVFAGLQMADYLMLMLPDVRVFMDLRAQLGYSLSNFRDYYTILAAGPGKSDEALRLLDHFKVEYVIIDSAPKRRAALAIMETRKWACIYQDRWVTALARTDSKRFGGMLRSADINGLWYKDARTRVITGAMLAFFMKGGLSPEQISNLKATMKEWPDPETYSLLTTAMNRNKNGLDEEVARYLTEEQERLSRKDYMVAGGVRDILESRARILQILYESEAARGRTEAAVALRQRQAELYYLMKALMEKYSVTMRLR